jgi:hypothetical protein
MLTRPAIGVNKLLRYMISVVCAGSVGVHVGLIPDHVDEGAAAEVAAFVAVSVLLVVLTAATRNPRYDGWAPAAAAVTLFAVTVAYALSRTSGIPVLVPEPESLDIAGIATSVAELIGAAAGITLFIRTRKENR